MLAAGLAYAVEEEGAAGNVYMTGAEVRIDRAVKGDLVAAAGRIRVDQPVAGDAFLGAGSLDVQATLGDDLRAAGGIVTIANRVKGEVIIAAGRVILTPGAEIHGQAWLAGGHVSVDGRSLGGVKVYGREVTVGGEIHGPVELSAHRIRIRSSARIYGDLTYSGADEIEIDPLARVTGKVTRQVSALQVREPSANIPGLKPMRPLLLAGLFGAAALLHALVPGFIRKCVYTLGVAPAKSLGLGSALFFSVPPIAVLLIITIIGIPMGLALAAFHAVALVVGYLVTGFFIADKLAQPLNRPPQAHGWRLTFTACALVLLALATSIPYIGALILLVAVVAGLGAIVLQAFGRSGAAPRASRTADAGPGA